MKRVFFTLVVLSVLSPANVFAYLQGAPFQPSFDAFAAYMSSMSNVMLQPVKGFHDADCYYAGIVFSDKPSLRMGSAIGGYAADQFGPVWYSKHCHCVILYGWDAIDLSVKQLVQKELNGNVADGTGNVADHPERFFLTAEPMSRSGFADGDSLFVYQFPKPERFWFMFHSDEYEKYIDISANQWPRDHCLGVLIEKNGIPYLHFKLLLSNKGFKHKDKYIDKLLASIRFEE